jgi:hypothetical protein
MSARAFLRGGLNAPDGGARNALARRCCRHLTELRHSLSGLAPRSRRPHRIRLGVRRVSVTLADAFAAFAQCATVGRPSGQRQLDRRSVEGRYLDLPRHVEVRELIRARGRGSPIRTPQITGRSWGMTSARSGVSRSRRWPQRPSVTYHFESSTRSFAPNSIRRGRSTTTCDPAHLRRPQGVSYPWIRKVFTTRGVCQVVSLSLAMSSSVRFRVSRFSPALLRSVRTRRWSARRRRGPGSLGCIPGAGAGDGHDEVVLVQHPRQRNLRGA